MKPEQAQVTERRTSGRYAAVWVLGCVLAGGGAVGMLINGAMPRPPLRPDALAAASPPSAPASPLQTRPAVAAAPVRTGDLSWNSLTTAQRQALKPLQRDWAGIDTARRLKWLEIAQRYRHMSPQEQTRLHQRMREWARLSPKERNKARLTFREARGLSPQERQDRWNAYLALPAPQRQQLASEASRPPPGPKSGVRGTIANSDTRKSNIVPNPLHLPAPQPVAIASARARPGATTVPLSQQPTTTWHQQTGLPKIVALPGFIDRNTLLPRVGPQGLGAKQAAPEPNR